MYQQLTAYHSHPLWPQTSRLPEISWNDAQSLHYITFRRTLQPVANPARGRIICCSLLSNLFVTIVRQFYEENLQKKENFTRNLWTKNLLYQRDRRISRRWWSPHLPRVAVAAFWISLKRAILSSKHVLAFGSSCMHGWDASQYCRRRGDTPDYRTLTWCRARLGWDFYTRRGELTRAHTASREGIREQSHMYMWLGFIHCLQNQKHKQSTQR